MSKTRRRGSDLTAEQEREIAHRSHAAEDRARRHLSKVQADLPGLSELLIVAPASKGRTRAASVLALEAAVRLLTRSSRSLTRADRRRAERAAEAIAEAQRIRWELAASATRIAFGEARKLSGAMPPHDLFQEGRVGLYNAALRFDPDRGLRFSTYARWWCRAAITRAIDRNGRAVRMPAGAIELRRNIVKLVREQERSGSPWTYVSIAADMQISPEKVAALLDSLDDTHSLDAPIHRDDATGRLVDHLADPSQDVDVEMDEHILAESVRTAVGRLPKRHAEIIALLYGLKDGRRRTLAEVGKMKSLSRERIRQIRNQAFETLRGKLEDFA